MPLNPASRVPESSPPSALASAPESSPLVASVPAPLLNPPLLPPFGPPSPSPDPKLELAPPSIGVGTSLTPTIASHAVTNANRQPNTTRSACVFFTFGVPRVTAILAQLLTYQGLALRRELSAERGDLQEPISPRYHLCARRVAAGPRGEPILDDAGAICRRTQHEASDDPRDISTSRTPYGASCRRLAATRGRLRRRPWGVVQRRDGAPEGALSTASIVVLTMTEPLSGTFTRYKFGAISSRATPCPSRRWRQPYSGPSWETT